MIDFKGLDKTQIRFVERDCPDIDMLHRICINNFIDANPVLNKLINSIVDNLMSVYPTLKYVVCQQDNDDILDKIRSIVEYYQLSCRSIDEEIYISEFILTNFNTKQHRAWLTEIFGEKVHEEDFMTNLQFVIGKIIYAILYV